jgi:hypothetical protein
VRVESSSWCTGAACVGCTACVIGPSAALADPLPGSRGASVTTGARVVVPDVAREEVSSAYRALRRCRLEGKHPAWLCRGHFRDASGAGQGRHSGPGTRVPAASAVSSSVPCRACRDLAHMAPAGRLPSYRVPELVGHKLGVAYRWLAHKSLVSQVQFAPLRNGSAARLQANYQVTARDPAPATLSLGTRPTRGPRDAINQTR